MSKPKTTTHKRTRKATAAKASAKAKVQRPTILVMEGLSGAMYPVIRAGGKPKVVDPRRVAEVDRALAEPFDALLLTGGGDVDPRLYGEKPGKQVYGVNETRDLTEWAALDRAKELGVPVLGICRGHQLIAVHNGGKLKQHINGHRGQDHPAFTEPGSKFADLVGEKLMTVSLHHQAVKRTGRGFRVAARSPEGLIESIESTDGRVRGVQFHPEMNYSRNEQSRAIFRWLVTAAAEVAGMPVPDETREPERRSYGADPVAAGFLPPPVRKAKARHRKAGQQTLPGMGGTHPAFARRSSAPMTITWQCPACPVRFDEEEDRDDHALFRHGICIGRNAHLDEDAAWLVEPPEGHPDWD